MAQQEAATLFDQALPSLKVQPTVIVSILNSYMRRNIKESRVIGTLLGEVSKDGVVTVSDCFAVPYTERPDEVYVAINQDYHKTMYAFHKRNSKKEVIVGWYTTTTVNGEFINDNSSLIHDFYASECANPVHIVVDTTLTSDTIATRGFVSKHLTVGENVLANTFREIRTTIDMTETEATCLYHMIHGQIEQAKWATCEATASIPTEQDKVDKAFKKLSTVLDDLQRYVDAVVDGKVPPNRQVGMAIADAVNAAAMHGEQQAGLQAKVQDLLMISYLSTLTQTQTLVAEKLNEIL